MTLVLGRSFNAYKYIIIYHALARIGVTNEISAKVVSSLVCMEILDTDVGAVHMMY